MYLAVHGVCLTNFKYCLEQLPRYWSIYIYKGLVASPV